MSASQLRGQLMVHRGPRQLGAVGGPQQDPRLRRPLRLQQLVVQQMTSSNDLLLSASWLMCISQLHWKLFENNAIFRSLAGWLSVVTEFDMIPRFMSWEEPKSSPHRGGRPRLRPRPGGLQQLHLLRSHPPVQE